MKSRDALALTALCATGATADPALADQWDVAVRPIGLPQASDTEAAPKRGLFAAKLFTAPKKKQPSPQELFAAAIKKDDIAGASAAADRADDPALSRQLAWALFNASRPGEARDWFMRSNAAVPTAEAHYGIALAAYELKDLDAADAALSNSPQPQDDETLQAQMAQLQARIALRRADDAMARDDFAGVRQYAALAASRSVASAGRANRIVASADFREAQLFLDKGDYARARALAHDAAHEPELAEAAAPIEAWAALKAGAHADASKLFDELYRRTQSPDAAQGLMLAYSGDPDAPDLGAIAKTEHGPLKALIVERLAEQAFARNDFVTASYAPKYQESLASVSAPWVQQTTRFDQRNGEAGRDSLKVVQSVWSVGATHGPDLLQADIAFAHADAGQASPAANIGTPSSGTPGAARAFAGTKTADTWSPQLQWRREADLSPEITIGASPIGGAIDAAFIGSAGLRAASNSGESRVTAFARPRGDSLLASSGIKDPATGLAWGRVIESGVEAAVRRQVFNQYSLSASLSASRLEGEHTASNERLSAGVSFSKNWQVSGFKYFAVGPFYGYESYDKNVNEFTYGNGGYFSPQDYHRIGLGLNFQTQEARRVVVRGDVSVAYEKVREQGVDVLPLTAADAFGVRAETRNTGLSGAASVAAAYRLNDRVAFVAEAGAVKSAEFESVRAAIGLRYIFGGGSTVTSSFLSQTSKGIVP